MPFDCTKLKMRKNFEIYEISRLREINHARKFVELQYSILYVISTLDQIWKCIRP